jgi:acetyltransferase-like isoleucine patch superfamily enzyme
VAKLKIDPDNKFDIPKNLKVNGFVCGKNNKIEIGDVEIPSTVTLRIFGNNNHIKIDSIFCTKALDIRIGVRESLVSNNCKIHFGKNFWSEPNLQLLLYNHENKLDVGDDCLFSNNITIRLGDRPHLIFDSETGEYIDNSTDGVLIGDRVWVGEKVYITKNVTILNDCILAVNSVVTERFEETNCVIAGNPAKVVKKNVQWIRNDSDRFLEEGSNYKISYDQYEENHKYEEK